ncbi:rap1 GTPase-GDP dissociation stimulator 1-like isoform X1 [Acipenser oxyrinchus oxyrinchus]|uniref:Rap1 GTPase-GDP dissociation stimulator 1-like isoform X1 n=1 Tax=Acipenser oxyrinchus oxyrinchus TaxID=40147 RepID=A0AAD8D6C4_ACIOX|nr:rap1 GTPase-GDP dissociation stimulator 1-like isoform X1 [Acipenser oxyrinchus oxyrinchus]
MDSLSAALEQMKANGGIEEEEELRTHLDTLLRALEENREGAAEQIVASSILPSLAAILRRDTSLTAQATLVTAELAKNAEVREPCIQAGFVSALVPLLETSDQELLLHTGRAIGRICFNNSSQQEALVQCGVIPRLVGIMKQFPENDVLVNVCLLALSNLADLDSAREALIKMHVAEVLTVQLRRAPNAERRHIILEVLGALGESDSLKLQFVDSEVPEALSEMIRGLQAGMDPPDLCSVKIASSLIVSLLLGDEAMQKCFGDGSSTVYQDILSWLQSPNIQLQLSGALAIANFARNDGNCIRMVDSGVVSPILDLLERHVDEGDVSVQHSALSALRNLAIPAVNKVRMLQDGVSERIRKLLRSDMPPVQFKLLGTLRMMVDGQEEAASVLGQDEALLSRVMQWCDARDHAGVRGEANRLLAALIRHSRAPEVVKAVTRVEGMQHLITMATNEHVIMQNEALVALAIASTIDIDAVVEPFMSAGLLSTLQQMLEDPVAAVEVKFSTVGLVCSLANSVELRSQMEALALRETLGKLSNHGNTKLASQADTALSILAETS